MAFNSHEYYLKNKPRLLKAMKIYESKNHEKIKAWKAKYEKARYAVKRDSQLREDYNISLQEYNALKDKQNNGCAICGGSSKKDLAVDHCHKTGKIRGLLCIRCNRGLGCFKDDSRLLTTAISYLERC